MANNRDRKLWKLLEDGEICCSSAVSREKMPSRSTILTVNTSYTETEGLIEEINERQKKSNNIIIYNVPEHDNNSVDDNTDSKFVNVLLTTICNEPIIPSKIIRLGQKTGNEPIIPSKIIRLGQKTAANTRPIKLVLPDKRFAMIIMRSSEKLKLHDTYKNIYLQHDLTFQQREYSRVNKKEFVGRKASGESGIGLKCIHTENYKTKNVYPADKQ
ncbi:hypothetical protein QE152_g33735 [Popillia japonica]|uniref:Uncharacterized protein n=1 Tax=Popillia japonica TaxID=7064 RepID=A0AAW1IVS6_POPJA